MTRLYQVTARLFVEADSESEGAILTGRIGARHLDALCAACDEPRGAKR